MKIATSRPFLTPEGASLTVRVAGPGARAAAWMFDLALRAGVYLVLALILGLFGLGGVGVVMLVAFAGEWLYFALYEGLTGTTPGKRRMGLAVVQRNGAPAGLEAAFVRNLVRFVDMLPPPYGFGLISAYSSPDFQRLGDRAAGTIVIYAETVPTVRARRRQLEEERRHRALLEQLEPLAPLEPLTGEEESALLEFARRAPSWSKERSIELSDLLEPLTGASGERGLQRVLGHAAWLEGRGS